MKFILAHWGVFRSVFFLLVCGGIGVLIGITGPGPKKDNNANLRP